MGEKKNALPIVSDEEEVYWSRAKSDSVGIVVATTWMFCKPRHFQKHSRLYASCNWDSLVGHPNVLNLWFPNMATALAIRILDKLVQEVQDRPRPIVFATFSGGYKACLYRIFQILDGSYEGSEDALVKYRAVRECYAGQIHDSSPVDFVSRNGANFVTHPVILGTKKRNKALTWSAHGVAKTLDFFFLPRFEAQRTEMWTSLEKSWTLGPVLVFGSKDDDLADFEGIQNFSSQMSALGCKITLIEWDESTHVAHLRRHPEEYASAVTAFLSDAAESNTLKLVHFSHQGFESTDVDDSISRSATSSSMFSGQTVHSKNQNLVSVRLESETSSDGRTRFWIPSRM